MFFIYFIGIGILYLSIISIFSFIIFVCTLYPDFHGPKFRKLRGSLFLILGVSTCIPIFHLAIFGKYVNGFETKSHLIFWYIGGIYMLWADYSLYQEYLKNIYLINSIIAFILIIIYIFVFCLLLFLIFLEH